MSGASLSVPGVLFVGTSEQSLSVLHVGPAAGWVSLKGLHTWSREISVVLKTDLDEAVRRDLKIVLPEGHPAAAGLQNARRAALASTLVAIDPTWVEKLAGKGLRVHTVGSDRITGGFYYFAKGGSTEPVRVQGNLIEMIAGSLASADNAAIEASLDGIIDRLLAELSGGKLTEAQIELAAALPAIGESAEEAAVKLQTLEGFLAQSGSKASKFEQGARAVVDALDRAAKGGEDVMQVPLFGDVRRVLQPTVEIEFADGESGALRKLALPERGRWFVAGLVTESVPPPAVAPAVDKAAAEKAAAEKAAVAKAAAEKAATEKAAAEKAAAEKAAAEKAAAAKAAAEKAAAEKAAAEKAAAEKAAAEKAAAEKAAAEKAAAEKAAAEKVAAEKVAAEKAAAEKVAAEKVAAEKAAAEKVAAEKAAAEKVAAEKAAAEKAAAKKATAEKETSPQKKKKKGAAGGERAAQPVAARGKAADKNLPAKTDAPSSPIWIWLVLALAAAGTFYFAWFRHHHH